MRKSDVATLRLRNHLISHHPLQSPAAVVSWLGAVQAQDYLGGLWAIGARLPAATEQSVLAAIDAGQIIRTWPMRGTLHFVAADDVRWMLDLLTPRVLGAYGYRMRYHGITVDIYAKASKLVGRALAGGVHLTREELYATLERGGISPAKGLGLHILGRLALEQLMCFGPRRGKQHTFVSFDAWVPKGKQLTRDEGLCELSIRYFQSHGPAQLSDFAWWSGLTMKEVKLAVEHASAKLQHVVIDDATYYLTSAMLPKEKTEEAFLLPPFDEYVVSYKDRSAVLEAVHAERVNPGANGMLSAVVVVDGQLVGTWKRSIKKNNVAVATSPFVRFSSKDLQLIRRAQERYTAFLNL